MNEKNLIKWVRFDILESFMTDVLAAAGVPEADASICADVLITADKLGIDSHGINRLKPVYYDRILSGIQNPVTKIDILKESPCTAVIDGNNGMGQVISKKAMTYAIEKAGKCGISMVAVRNSNHYGIAGYYPMMAAEAGMIGITGTNARPSIAPTFGIENMLGTNPLTFGLPTDEEFPFLLDCATSVSQRGKIEVYARKHKDIPEGWVIGQDGRFQTDPNIVLEGLLSGSSALVPLGGAGEDTGGYKGYGYATVVEIMSSALQNGHFLKDLSGVKDGQKVPLGLGHFFIAINISFFTELDDFKKTAGNILRGLRASRKMPGEERIYTAGEKEYMCYQDREKKGAPINPELQKEIRALVKELSLDRYDFGF